jgi:serine/threonine protein kinase
VILYEMVASKLPFEGPSPSHTIVAILEHDPQPFEHPSAELRQVIATALQKDRTLRFQSAEAMSAALDESKHRLGYFSDQKIDAPPPVEKKTASKQSSVYRKLAWIVPVALVILLGGAIAIFAAIAFLMNNSSVSNTNTNLANLATPVATSTVAANSVVVAATPTPTFVSPTPLPTATPIEKEPADRQPRPTPARTPVRVEPRKTPGKKPKQDPNCVFTNTCS